ncbi:MAG: hypothetical protein WA045_00145 [Nitrospira sp.]
MPSERARLPFEIDRRINSGLITAHAEVPLVIELFRRVGAAQIVEAQVQIKQRPRGLTPAQLVEPLIALCAVGGDCSQDLQTPCSAIRCQRRPRCGTSWKAIHVADCQGSSKSPQLGSSKIPHPG